VDKQQIVVDHIGPEREPVIVIDNFAADPNQLREFALRQPFVPAGRHYPGVKADLPPHYFNNHGSVLATLARDVFKLLKPLRVLESRFSVVTTPASALSIEKRLPHIDAVDSGRLALIHYLVPGGTTGTAFYRHRSTGFATVNTERAAIYLASLNSELHANGLPDPAYPSGDTALFECLKEYPGRYNRALLYRSSFLHSGVISASDNVAKNPALGRLTVTGFFTT